MTTYSSAEVQAHNTPECCWVIYNDGVFNLTSFVQDHPGGEEYILDHAGQDITELMKDVLSHSHSEGAYEMMKDFRVGTLGTSCSSLASLGQRQPTSLAFIQSSDDEDDYAKPTDLAVDKKAKFLDLSKPLFWQLWNSDFSKAFYLEQVHIPRHLSKPAEIFGVPFLEFFTKTVWYMIPIFWLPIVAYNIKRSLDTGLMADQVAVYFFIGMAIGSLAEYVIHRFLFHLDDQLPDSTACLTLHFVLHGIHHYLPMDRLRLVLPPAMCVALILPVNALVHFVFVDSPAYAVMAGTIFFYILYDMTHYFLHHSKQPFSHFKELRTYHLAHHYKDFQGGYGVTSKIWDRIFNTEIVL